MTVKINADTSDGLKFVSDTSGTVDIQSNGTTKMSVTSTDITAPAGVSLNIHGSNSAGTLDGYFIRDVPRLVNDTSTFEHTYLNSGNSADVIITIGSSTTTSSNTEQARFRSNGRVDFGTGSYTNGAKLTLTHLGNQVVGLRMSDETTTGTHNALQFLRGGTQVGKIETANQASTSYVTSSDYRMKENVNYSWDGTTKLKQLKPAEFTWKEEFDTNKTQVQGFLAHEVSNIVPEAVTGTKDATKQEDVFDDDGVKTGTKTVPDYQGIDQSKLVPLLVKTIQELEARITALESE
jgi:hypothetical protein